MNPAPDYWSTLQQVRRILRYDLQRLLTDILLGFVFILASYAVSRASQYDSNGYLIAPMGITSLYLLYLNTRLIAEETSADTIQFYANLPRDKQITYWTRTIFIIVITALCYLLNIVGLHIRYYLDSEQTYSIRPMHWALPTLTVLLSCWAMYLVQNNTIRNVLWITGFAFVYPVLMISLSWSGQLELKFFPAVLIISPFLIMLLARKWKLHQPGGAS